MRFRSIDGPVHQSGWKRRPPKRSKVLWGSSRLRGTGNYLWVTRPSSVTDPRGTSTTVNSVRVSLRFRKLCSSIVPPVRTVFLDESVSTPPRLHGGTLSRFYPGLRPRPFSLYISVRHYPPRVYAPTPPPRKRGPITPRYPPQTRLSWSPCLPSLLDSPLTRLQPYLSDTPRSSSLFYPDYGL